MSAPGKDKTVQTTLAFLEEVFGRYHPRDFAVRLWDGTVWSNEHGYPARFTLVLNHPGALRAMFLPPGDLSLGEAYIYNDFDIEGDITAVFGVADFLMHSYSGMTHWMHHARQLLSLPHHSSTLLTRHSVKLTGKKHSKSRDKQAVAFHYSRSNEFFALWLDRRMVYSCAYFATANDDLDTAQERKLDYICRKLRLRPGDRLLDIGCGWGALIMHATQHFHVEALGITISEAQSRWANQRIRELGLDERCRVETCDYRDLTESSSFDKLVSVGMFEHVGKALLPRYFAEAWRLLRPGGVFLNHGISKNTFATAAPSSRFFDRYVFPDGEVLPISVSLRAAEMAGFEIRDVESLREHYLLTAKEWLRRLVACADQVSTVAGETTFRIWKLYLAAGAYSFEVNWGNIYQTLLAKPDHGKTGLPMTRADWYTEAEQ